MIIQIYSSCIIFSRLRN